VYADEASMKQECSSVREVETEGKFSARTASKSPLLRALLPYLQQHQNTVFDHTLPKPEDL
jgi:hypothetical protein